MTKLDELMSYLLSDDMMQIRGLSAYNRLVRKGKELQQEQVKNLTIPIVVGQGEQCGLIHSTDWSGKCFNCGTQVFIREPK